MLRKRLPDSKWRTHSNELELIMEKQENVRVITFGDFWSVFVHNILIILIVTILVVGGVFAFIAVTFEPEYTSTATLYILRQNQKEDDYQVKEDFSLALNVVNDCTYLLKSHAVLDEVRDQLGLDISYNQLTHSLTTNNPEDTRILEVSIVSDSPEKSKLIVDKVCELGAKQIETAMGLIDYNPCNQTSIMTYLVIGVVTALIVYAICLIAYFADDRIRTEEDISRYLGLSLLGDIPNAYENTKGRNGYYGKYSHYQYEASKESSKQKGEKHNG